MTSDLLALSSSGPSVAVTGWIATLLIIAGVITSVGIIWKIAWPLMKVLVSLNESLPFVLKIEEHQAATTRRLDNHEQRITVVEGHVLPTP